MTEDCTMPTEESVVRLILEKPIDKLTEDDIAQLTREDCRRYLKEKGMRRPSWNKSQAIQQVIMLKSLLETTPDSDAGSSKRLRILCPANSHGSKNPIPDSVPTGTADDAENSVSAEEMAQHCRKDVDKPDSSGGFPGCFPTANDDSALPRATGSTHAPLDQMTIFYCGKVNVYDNVPADQARTIMHTAASPLYFAGEQPVDRATMLQSLSYLSKPTSLKAWPDSAAIILPTPQTENMRDNSLELGEESVMPCQDTPLEGPSTRKASVQRYLEKRKDRSRFKSKRKVGPVSCANEGMYFNHKIGDQMSRGEINSQLQMRPLPTPACCGSANDPEVNVSRYYGLIYEVNPWNYWEGCLGTKQTVVYKKMFFVCQKRKSGQTELRIDEEIINKSR